MRHRSECCYRAASSSWKRAVFSNRPLPFNRVFDRLQTLSRRKSGQCFESRSHLFTVRFGPRFQFRYDGYLDLEFPAISQAVWTNIVPLYSVAVNRRLVFVFHNSLQKTKKALMILSPKPLMREVL